MNLTVDVVIPTYYPGERLLRILEMLKAQTVQPRCVRIFNTEQAGLTSLLNAKGLSEAELLAHFPFLTLEHLAAEEFDHGGTRNRGFLACGGADYVLTMTQDALPGDETLIEQLLAALRQDGDGIIAVSYARQVPNENASLEEKLSRGFNYPETSRVKSLADLPELGVKTYFCSNVCALYRMEIWHLLGGFPQRAIFNEDTIYAAKALQSGYRTAYAARAWVYHSHSYTASQQFHRNFDLGVSQAQNPEVYGNVRSESEGIRYVKAVIEQMSRERQAHCIPGFLWRSAFRLAGYRLGKAYQRLPRALVIRCSSNRNYWDESR